jgi:hypothetical protein
MHMMNAQKNNQIDLVEQAMRQTFAVADNQVDYNIDAWSDKVMADIRAESIEEPINLKLLSGVAWFALAASLLFAAVVYISGDNDNSDSIYDYYSEDPSILESAYRN